MHSHAGGLEQRRSSSLPDVRAAMDAVGHASQGPGRQLCQAVPWARTAFAFPRLGGSCDEAW
jgi:hypothetical protein